MRDRAKLLAKWRRHYQKHRVERLEWQRKYRQSRLEEVKAKDRAYHQSHREESKKKNRAYYEAHRGKKAEYNRAYGKSHSKEIAAHVRVYRRTHAESVRARNHLYRSRERGAKGSFTAEQFTLKCEYYGWRCYLCGKELVLKNVTIDHKIPLSRSGTNWIANLAPACIHCNCSKKAKTSLEYRNGK